MTRRSALTDLILAGIVTGALLFLAASLTPGEFKAGLGLPPDILERIKESLQPPRFSLSPALWTVARVLFWGALLMSLYLALATREARRAVWRRTTIPVLLIILTLLLGLLGTDATRDIPQQPLEPAPAATRDPIDALEPTLEPDSTQLPEIDPGSPLASFLAVIFGTALFFALLVWGRRRLVKSRSGTGLEELHHSALGAIEEIRQGARLDDAILHCYRQMAGVVAAQHGMPLNAWETPREYEHELVGIGLPRDAVHELTRLFELVRYGGYGPMPADQAAAVSALEAIVVACRQPRPAASQRLAPWEDNPPRPDRTEEDRSGAP